MRISGISGHFSIIVPDNRTWNEDIRTLLYYSARNEDIPLINGDTMT